MVHRLGRGYTDLVGWMNEIDQEDDNFLEFYHFGQREHNPSLSNHEQGGATLIAMNVDGFAGPNLRRSPRQKAYSSMLLGFS